MSGGGYTPLFRQITTGTLCGKWPDIGLWPIVLSLSDRDGIVDVTPAYLSSVTGLGLDEVVACMERFCQPDPYSRTTEHDGRRLELVDAGRPWGWRILNHGKYREKARKAAYDSVRTASGQDAARKRAARASDPTESPNVPTRPDASREVPLSNTNTNTNTNTNPEEEGRASAPDPSPGADPPEPRPEVGAVTGVNPEAFAAWDRYLRQTGRPLNEFSRAAAKRKLLAMGDEARQAATVEHCIANGWRTLHPIRDEPVAARRLAEPRKTGAELEAEWRAQGRDPWAMEGPKR